jgi:hypothetical protein
MTEPDPASPQYEWLQYLCTGHFHPDWSLDFATRDAVLADVATNDADSARKIAEEARAVLAGEPTEHEIETLLDVLDCNVNPSADGETWRSFLERVAALGS